MKCGRNTREIIGWNLGYTKRVTKLKQSTHHGWVGLGSSLALFNRKLTVVERCQKKKISTVSRNITRHQPPWMMVYRRSTRVGFSQMIVATLLISSMLLKSLEKLWWIRLQQSHDFRSTNLKQSQVIAKISWNMLKLSIWIDIEWFSDLWPVWQPIFPSSHAHALQSRHEALRNSLAIGASHPNLKHHFIPCLVSDGRPPSYLSWFVKPKDYSHKSNISHKLYILIGILFSNIYNIYSYAWGPRAPAVTTKAIAPAWFQVTRCHSAAIRPSRWWWKYRSWRIEVLTRNSMDWLPNIHGTILQKS